MSRRDWVLQWAIVVDDVKKNLGESLVFSMALARGSVQMKTAYAAVEKKADELTHARYNSATFGSFLHHQLGWVGTSRGRYGISTIRF
jgi:hypothetical protein